MTPGGPIRVLVVDEAFDWEGDVSPHRSLAETVIYEVHVKNLTDRLPGGLVGALALRGR